MRALVASGEFDAIPICAGDEGCSSPVLARLGRLHGVAAVESGRKLRGQTRRLRRVLDPLMRWVAESDTAPTHLHGRALDPFAR